MDQQGTNSASLFRHFWVKSEFVQPRGEDTSLLKNTEWNDLLFVQTFGKIIHDLLQKRLLVN